MSELNPGDVYTIQIYNIKNKAGTLTDPTTLLVTVEKPDGTETPYTYPGAVFTHVSTGNYEADISLDQAGRWKASIVATGNGVDFAEGARWRVYALPTG